MEASHETSIFEVANFAVHQKIRRGKLIFGATKC